MNSSQFKKNELKRLSSIVGVNKSDIIQITSNIDNYYQEWTENKKDTKTGDLKKYKDGTIKKRIIRPSRNELKKIQSNIKSRILAKIILPDSVHGGVKKKSNITNAKQHQGKKYQLTTDLQDFYPNITSQQVYNAFLKHKFSPHYSHWLTKLTTWKHVLPQGTPTSTHVANLVFFETDIKLFEFCIKNDITYTRYVDDLTFSSQCDFRHLVNDLLDIVTSSGFKLSYRKTLYKGNQTITGINVFLNKIDAPNHIIEKSKIEQKTNSSIKPYTNYLSNIRKTNQKTT